MFRQRMRARFLIRKPGIERRAGHGFVVFPSGWHSWNQNIVDWQAASHYIKCCRSKGDKPLQQEFFNSIGRSLRSCIKGGIQRIAR
jgi:hypothetical protein